MSIKRLVPLNTVSLPSNPPTAIAGDIYYNSGLSKLLYFNGTDWIELAGSANSLVYAKSIYQDVRNQSGATIPIGTPVYISGAIGASGKILISPASNASEATSSKTMAITTSAISNNSNGQIISEGLLEGIDTTGASDGDPVWLGVNGAKIYGLANKPAAPAHLVFLGIVVNGGSANAGSIFVKIQNGFELEEIHNVSISSLLNGNILAYDSTTSTWKNTNTLQSTASTVPLVIKGSASQTANLQEWQNSSGNVVASVFKDGISIQNNQTSLPRGLTITQSSDNIGAAAFIARKSRGTNESPVSVNNGDIIGAFAFTGYNGTVYPIDTTLFGAAVTAKSGSDISQSLYFTTGTSGFGNYVPNLLVYHDGRVGIGSGFGSIIGTINQPSATLQIGSLGAAIIGTIIKGAASQTANLQEWQDSTASPLAWVNFGGGIRGVSFRTATLNAVNAPLAILATSTSSPAAVIRALASQTANIQEWQDSAGTALSNINNVGAANFVRAGIGGTTPGTTPLFVTSPNASYIATIIRAASGQTANILEFQNSAGGLYSRFDSSGQYQGVYAVLSSDAVGTLPLKVKGASGQTANLTEWHNSAGTILLGVTAGGGIYNPSNTSAASFGMQSNTGTPQGAYFQVFGNNHASSTQRGGAEFVFSSENSGTGGFTVFQYQSGAWTPRFKVFNGGFTSINSTSATLGGGSVSSQLGVVINGATTVGSVIRGAASQTANLQEWQDSSGTVLSNITYFGGARLYDLGIKGSPAGIGWAYFGNDNTSTKNVVVRAFASQTASLQEWQNSAGTSLVNISSSGVLNTNANINLIGVSAGGLNRTIDYGDSYGAAALYLYNAGNNARWGWGLNPGEMQFFATNDSATNHFSWNRGGDLQAVGTNEIMRLTVGTGATSTLNLNTGGTAATGLVIKGVASQTANLQEWHNSTGTTLAVVGNTGTIRSSVFANLTPGLSYIATNYDTSGVGVVITNAAYKGLVVRGVASQTANLQEWQDSAGTVLSGISPAGQIFAGTTASINGSTTTAITSAAYTSATVAVFTYGGTSLVQAGQVVKVAGVTGGTYNGTWKVTAVTSTTFTVLGSGFTNVAGTGGTFTLSAVGSFIASTAAITPLVVQGAASQTANLQEWQDSAGNVLAGASNTSTALGIGVGAATSGFFILNGAYGGFGNVEWSVRRDGGNLLIQSPAGNVMTSTYDAVVLAVKGKSGQTANLQEWQNSAGTVLTSISSAGKLTSAVDASINGMTIGLGGGNVSSNVAFGQGALASNVSGQNNTAIGYNALNSSTSYFNVAIGGSALQSLTTGGTNVALGVLAMRYATTADSAVAIGYSAAGATTTGGYFVAIGSGALGANVTGGTDTVAIGYAALNQATATSATTAVGSGAGYALTTGTQNTYLGRVADGVTTGSNNMMLGYSATASSTTVSNEITLGNSSITRFRIPGIGLNITSNSTINTASAATVGLIIKGAASQTANLQEWQNSAGTVLAAINSGGAIRSGTFASLTNGLTIIVTNFDTSGIGITPQSAAQKGLIIRGAASQTANLQEWQNSSSTVLAKVDANGNFSAISKSFDIPHPTKESMRLRYASLEGNEHGVYVRGITKEKFIELPEYWTELVDESTITVSLTSVGKFQKVYVEKIEDNKIYIGGRVKEISYAVFGERKDIDKLIVEY